MDDNKDNKIEELESVKKKLESYAVFKANVPNYAFYARKKSNTITEVCAHDVLGQIDTPDGTQELKIDTVKFSLLHDGELVKSFDNPIFFRIFTSTK